MTARPPQKKRFRGRCSHRGGGAVQGSPIWSDLRTRFSAAAQDGGAAVEEADVPLGRPRSYALRLLVLALAVACSLFVTAVAVAANPSSGFHRDDTPLPASISGASTSAGNVAAASSGGGNPVLRMLLGLGIVLAIIYGLYRLLKRSADKNDKGIKAHGRMTVVASTPLAQSRALHLVQVGGE